MIRAQRWAINMVCLAGNVGLQIDVVVKRQQLNP